MDAGIGPDLAGWSFGNNEGGLEKGTRGGLMKEATGMVTFPQNRRKNHFHILKENAQG